MEHGAGPSRPSPTRRSGSHGPGADGDRLAFELEVAAAGGHNVLLVGSPGAGKTMLARRLATILPTLSRDEALEVTQLHSVAGLLQGAMVHDRPFRWPTTRSRCRDCSAAAARACAPGEVSLAHYTIGRITRYPDGDGVWDD